MAKPEWGTKRVCLSCSARFYDMMRDPIVCPSCATVLDPTAHLKTRRTRSSTKAIVEKEEVKKAVEVDDDDLGLDDDDDAVLDDDDELDDDDDDVDDVPAKAVGDDDDEDEDEDENPSAIEDVSELGDDDVSDVIDADVEDDETRP